jgi:hypothetical protein
MLYIFRYYRDRDTLSPVGEFIKLFDELADDSLIAIMKNIINQTINKVKNPEQVSYELSDFIKEINVIFEHYKLQPVDINVPCHENIIKIEYNVGDLSCILGEQPAVEQVETSKSKKKLSESSEIKIEQNETVTNITRQPQTNNVNNIKLSTTTLNIINNNSNLPNYSYSSGLTDLNENLCRTNLNSNSNNYINPNAFMGMQGNVNRNDLPMSTGNRGLLTNLGLNPYAFNMQGSGLPPQQFNTGQYYPNLMGANNNLFNNPNLNNCYNNMTMGSNNNINTSNPFSRSSDISSLIQNPNFNPNDIMGILGLQQFLNLLNPGFLYNSMNPYLNFINSNLSFNNTQAGSNRGLNIPANNIQATGLKTNQNINLTKVIQQQASTNLSNLNINQILADLETYKNKYNIKNEPTTISNDSLLGKKRESNDNLVDNKSTKAGGKKAKTTSSESSESDNTNSRGKKKHGGGPGEYIKCPNIHLYNTNAEHFLENTTSLSNKAELERYLPYYEHDKLEKCTDKYHSFMKDHFPEMYRIDNFYLHIKQRSDKLQKSIKENIANFDRSLTLFDIEISSISSNSPTSSSVNNTSTKENDILKIWDPSRLENNQSKFKFLHKKLMNF